MGRVIDGYEFNSPELGDIADKIAEADDCMTYEGTKDYLKEAIDLIAEEIFSLGAGEEE